VVDTIRCPGCGRPVDVTAPTDVRFQIIQDREPDGARYVEIHLGRARIHRCLECVDGMWR
jgi:hypothetical protein